MAARRASTCLARASSSAKAGSAARPHSAATAARSTILLFTLFESLEAITPPSFACRGARKEIEEDNGLGMAAMQRGSRIVDWRMRARRKGVDDAHAGIDQGIGQVDDAQGRLAARHEHHGVADV